MLHLSTQDVVSSIEKSPLMVKQGIAYQEYQNFFGNNISKEIKDTEKMATVKLEKQHHKPRSRIDYSETLMKKLKIFFSNSKITKSLSTKFNMPLQFESVDIWLDSAGYFLSPHTDDSRIKLALQIYLGEGPSVGTSLFDSDNNVLETFQYKFNSGYALLNNTVSLHGTTGAVAENNLRKSLYVRYS
jgi:hypothetical protein